MVTDRITEWLAGLAYDDIPTEVIDKARLMILDSVGVAIGGRNEPAVDHLLAVIGSRDAEDDVPIFGRRVRAPAPSAALINGAMAHVLDYDDTLLPSRLHASGGLTAGLTAIGHQEDLPGRDLLVGFVAGFEIAARFAAAVHPHAFDLGWHNAGFVCPVGVAAGAGAMLGSDRETIARSFGIASSQSSGVRAHLGTMTKSLNVGHGAQAGVMSALLARQGFTANPRILDDRADGFLRLFAPQGPGDMDSGLGGEWMVLQDGFKPYACGVKLHAAIDGALRLRRRLNLDPARIERVEVSAARGARWVEGSPVLPATELEGKFSMYYVVAAALIAGHGFPSLFDHDQLTRPDIGELMSRSVVLLDPDLRQDQARVSVTVDGETHSEFVQAAIGTAGNPMSQTDLVDKFRHMVEPALGARPSTDLIQTLLTLEEGSVRRLTALTVPDVSSAFRHR